MAVLITIGILGGFVSGLLGVGGGTIFVPLMILVMGMNAHLAIGTSLVIIIPTALVGAWLHYRADMVDLKTALILTICAIIGVVIGAKLSIKLDAQLLRRIFAVMLILVALKLLFQK